MGPSDFELVKCLGRGAVGNVYLVSLKSSGTPPLLFAMKVLNKTEMRRKVKIQHVFEELHVLELAYHPFVEKLVYSFQSAESVYFVIEYCAGGDFSRTLQKQPKQRIFEAAAQFYASEVLLALEYLHQMGCIYRDLKPENILVHLSGHIMLTDFDLSKFVTALPLGPDHANPLARRVRVDSFVGTPEYMAPEVISGQLQSEAVDWWALGILIFEMLYGHTPFCGESLATTFGKVARAKLKFPCKPKVSEAAKDVVRSLLERNPHKRISIEKLKAHPWFGGIELAALLKQTPPFTPRLSCPTDTRYFTKFKPTLMDTANLNSLSLNAIDQVSDEFTGFDDVVRGPLPMASSAADSFGPASLPSQSQRPQPKLRKSKAQTHRHKHRRHQSLS